MEVEEIEQIKKEQLVPALRFKEFDGEWEKMKLGGIGKVSMCKRIMKDQTYPTGDIPFYKIGTFGKQADAFIDKELYKEFKNKYSYPKKGDVLIAASGATYGKTVVFDGNPAFFQDSNIVWIDNDETKVYNKFLNISYLRIKWAIETSTIPRLYNDIIRNTLIIASSLPEQQKIAAFLGALDKKIQQLTRKKELLEQYKKGLMQKLFSQEIRFKDENGNDYPDWEEKRLADLYSFYSTNSLSRDKLNYESGTVYNIHYGDIHTKFKSAFNIKEEIIPFVNDDVDLSKIKVDSYCKNGDLVMADASEDYADIGKTIELIDLKDEKVIAGLHTFLARPITSKTIVGFFSYLLKSWVMRKQIMVIAQGTKVLSLSTGRVGKLKLKLPVPEEQQKIADYLSNIDKKIASVNNQITQTQTFKKGLLQQMFV